MFLKTFMTKTNSEIVDKPVILKDKLVDGNLYYIHFKLPENRNSEQNNVSAIFQYNENSKFAIESIMHTYAKSNSFSVQDALLIDLTETFGSGKEPSITWCTENIPNIKDTNIAKVIMTKMYNTESENYELVPYSKYTYTGKEYDIGPELYYYGARYYNPENYAFTQPDTIIPNVYNPQNLNRYSYCLNNPMTYTDPDGHVAVPVFLVTGLLGAAAGGTVAFGFSIAIQYAQTGDIDTKLLLAHTAGGVVAGGVTGLTLGIGNGLLTGAGVTSITAGSISFMSVVGVTGNLVGGIAGRTTTSYIHTNTYNKAQVMNKNDMLIDILLGPFTGIRTPIKKELFIDIKKVISKETFKDLTDDVFTETAAQGIHNRKEIYEIISNNDIINNPNYVEGEYCNGC